MLEYNHTVERLDFAVTRLDCRIEVPEAWTDYFQQSGPLPANFDDSRRFARFYFRRKAIIEFRRALPALPRPECCCCIYTKDISRNGVAFLHCAQLFPMEKLKMWLPDKVHDMKVVRCIRHNNHCYEIGAVFERAARHSASEISGR